MLYFTVKPSAFYFIQWRCANYGRLFTTNDVRRMKNIQVWAGEKNVELVVAYFEVLVWHFLWEASKFITTELRH
jgi:hypothetical protein